jgi:hypothetical protein
MIENTSGSRRRFELRFTTFRRSKVKCEFKKSNIRNFLEKERLESPSKLSVPKKNSMTGVRSKALHLIVLGQTAPSGPRARERRSASVNSLAGRFRNLNVSRDWRWSGRGNLNARRPRQIPVLRRNRLFSDAYVSSRCGEPVETC